MKRVLTLTALTAATLVAVPATTASAAADPDCITSSCGGTSPDTSYFDLGGVVYNGLDDACGDNSLACSALWSVAGFLVSTATMGAHS